VDAYHGRGVVVAEFKLDVAIDDVFPSKNWRALACKRPHTNTHIMHITRVAYEHPPPSPLASPLPANIPDLNANLFWRLREYVNKVSLNKLVSVGSPTVACEQRREQHPGRCSRSSRARTTCSAGLSRVVGRRARSFQWPFRVTLSRQGTTGHCLLTRKSGRDEPERCCLLTEHSRGGECLESVLVKQRREFCRMCNERLSN
jgi:hypothetical protein